MIELHFTAVRPLKKKCLVMVGGVGDSVDVFQPLVDQICKQLPDYSACTFTLSSECEVGNSLLDIQAREVLDAMTQLVALKQFNSIDIFTTSMGAYATVKILLNSDYSSYIRKVIFFDPADYFLSAQFTDPNDEITWSGYKEYTPERLTVSGELKKYRGNVMIDVVHLTVRNHGPNGYVYADYSRRDEDVVGAYTRLNTDMVRKFYESTPTQNRGQYLEINHLPHGFVRDGNVKKNLEQVARITSRLLQYEQ